MYSLLCGVSPWEWFRSWVSESWNETTYVIVMCAFGLLGLLSLLSFFKKSFDKDKKPKWGMLVLSLVMFGLLALVAFARY